MHTVYLSLGSNIGNRKRAMREAIEKIGKEIGPVIRQSSLLETAPWGFESPNMFLNACVCVETELPPRRLLDATQRAGYRNPPMANTTTALSTSTSCSMMP